MLYIDKTCKRFVEVTASKDPVPGGGSVSALVGALGAALGHMVGALTVGKKKYADAEDEIMELMKESRELQKQLMDLVQEDMNAFEPLSKLYSMKPETKEEEAEKERLMEESLERACQVPIDIMEACGKAIELSKKFAEKGSILALSDAGASAIICKSALQAASLNVYINTNSMKNRERAKALNQICAMHMMNYTTMADDIFENVTTSLKKEL